jgi:lipoprotein NlpD
LNTRILFVAIALLAGCATHAPAPVVERGPPPTAPVPAVVTPPPAAEVPRPVEKPIPTHIVKRGETLVSIALQYGLDYRELAAWNSITNFNVLKLGQVLVLTAPVGSVATPGGPVAATGPVATPLAGIGPPIEARPLANTANTKVEPRGQKVPFSERALAQLSAGDPSGPMIAAAPAVAPSVTPPLVTPTPEPEPDKSHGTDKEDVDWMWPVKGKVLAPFTETAKGVDIGGRKGAPVLAAAGGRVVYAGTGVRGYGKLVIIKHNNTWLSAYAHNDNLLVKEQQDVKKGQKIAEMGSSDTDQVKLHFEVRRQGKPVDPAKILPPL